MKKIVQKTATIPNDVIDLAAELGLEDRLDAILNITREMYPGNVSLETGCDPESPEDCWITFHVEDDRETQQSIDWQLEWRRRVFELVQDCPRVICLSVMPR